MGMVIVIHVPLLDMVACNVYEYFEALKGMLFSSGQFSLDTHGIGEVNLIIISTMVMISTTAFILIKHMLI